MMEDSSKLPLPSFLDSSNHVQFASCSSADVRENSAKCFWPGVPASGRQSVFDDSHKKFTPPVDKNLVFEDESVKEVTKNVDALYKKATSTGNKEDMELWKKEKFRLAKTIRNVRKRQKLLSQPAADCMQQYYCDPCDRGFSDEAQYKIHCGEHIKCNVDGCPFIGHPKIVILHRNMQHANGLASKIMNLKTIEDIEKWRQERKRKFPLAVNIAKKKDLMELKKARGEVLKTRQFGQMCQRGRKCYDMNRHQSNHTGTFGGRKNFGKKFHKYKKSKRMRNKTRFQPDIIDNRNDDVKEISCHGFVMFCGTEALKTNVSNSNLTEAASPTIIEEDHMEVLESSYVNQSHNGLLTGHESDKVPEIIENEADSLEKPLQRNADDTSLIEHISDEIASSVVNENQKVGKTIIQELEGNSENANGPKSNISAVSDPMAILLNEDSDSDDEPPIEQPIIVSKSGHDNVASVDITEVGGALGSLMASYDISSGSDDEQQDPKPKKYQKSVADGNSKSRRIIEESFLWDPNKVARRKNRKRTSLLEKILADEIRHERNVILQCVRHIVKNNFFGVK